MMSSIVPMVTKARVVDRSGMSNRLPSGLNGYALVDDDDDGEEPYANSGVFPLLFEPRRGVERLKPDIVSHDTVLMIKCELTDVFKQLHVKHLLITPIRRSKTIFCLRHSVPNDFFYCF